MIKPIFCIGMPDGVPVETHEHLHNYLQKDYYVLIYRIKNNTPEFALFNVENADAANIEDVKQYIKNLCL